MKAVNIKRTTTNFVIPAILFIAILATFATRNVTADEVPAFFLKIAKNIPRIGRSEKYDDFYTKNSNIMDRDSRYSDYYRINDIAKRKIGYSTASDTAWQHFPLAIEGPPELWRTLAGYSNDPLYSVSDDFNNELWSRDKRTDDQEN